MAKEKPHFDVAAAVIRREGKVLVTRRPSGSHLEGYWEFPGGKQEPNETLRECLKREILEELSMGIRVDALILSVEHEYETKKVTLHFFDCRHVNGDPRSLENQEIKWVRPGELCAYTFPPPDSKIIEILMDAS